LVEPGVYRESGRACAFDPNQTCAISIAKDGISLIGRGATSPEILANAGSLSNGIAVGAPAPCNGRRIDGSRITGFVVQGFHASGIVVSCTERWELSNVRATDNRLYGVYATFAGSGKIEDSTAVGAARAGIHVGMSSDVRMDRNVAHDNVMGFEVREDLRTTVDGSSAFNNTAGIFESIMAGDPLERSLDNTLRDNDVRDNNRPNKCEPHDPVCLIRPGVGVAVVGGAHNVNFGNRVTDNRTFGIAVLDVCTAFNISPHRCGRLKFDPLPRFIITERNVALGNAIDLLWTANGRGNCWLHNRSKVRMPPTLPRCRSESR
jgi:hypothetical protein